MRLGLHISDFSWPGGPQQIGLVLAEVAQQAEAAGFDRITVMDHLWQIGAVGPPEAPMLEAYTTLGYLAAKTSTITLHAMVTAAVFRAPGLLSKAVTTLDVLSGGRGMLGLGAAWYEEEAAGLGLPFPPLGERMERVEEVVQVCLQMWSGSQAPFTGRHYQLERTLNSPMPVSQPRPRIMIAGSGERETLRMVAKYADACNIYTGQDIAAKLRVLREHCDREGRDYDQIEKTSTMLFDVGADGSRAGDLLAQLRALHEDGITVVYARMTAEGYQRQLGVIAREVIPVIADW